MRAEMGPASRPGAWRVYVMGDVGNGDHGVPTVLAVGLGPYRVVEVAGIGAVDCDEGYVAQVFPSVGIAQRFGRLGFGGGVIGEFDRNIVCVNGDQAEAAGVVQ